ncbi:MAG: hypothetical protein P1V81_14445 [Planctomycetota bacterium]|nr:hypothetical protein [Planctomycetota bacterium]
MANEGSNRAPLVLLVVLLLVGGAYFFQQITQRNRAPLQSFVSSLSSGDFAAVGDALGSTSSINTLPGGDLQVTDRRGRTVTVKASQLPFKASSGPAKPTSLPQPLAEADRALQQVEQTTFDMVALGASVDGVLEHPAVTLHLSVDGGRIHIDSIEP